MQLLQTSISGLTVGRMSADQIVDQILQSRGVPKEAHEHFLHPDFSRDLADAASMKGMSESVVRLKRAISKKERVVIFGDYDADGVPATALLTRVLEPLGPVVLPRIPLRAEGYGLTMEAVPQLLALKPDLLITVDNGTVAQAEIAEIVAAGVDVLVIDHHEPQEGHLADAALAIINPKQPGCTYPFKDMCACGLAWRVLEQLYLSLELDPQKLRWELDLVALSTVADMVPLVGENRVLTMFGLKVFQKTRNVGLRALAEVSGVDCAQISAGDLGFRLAPRINAPSRMHQELQDGQHISLSLLLSRDLGEARLLAAELNQANADRQRLVDTHLEQAYEQAIQYQHESVLVLYHPDWSSGVIGLVASRLLDQYRRPAIVLASEGEEVKGSVRTVDGIHALDLLMSAEQHLARWGGHAKAAGLTLKSGVEEFRMSVTEWMRTQIPDPADLAEQSYRTEDVTLSLEDMTLELARALRSLEPFGVGFPTPLVKVRASFASVRRVGSSGQHVSGFLQSNSSQVKCIAFNHADTPQEQVAYDVWVTLKEEEWRQVVSPVCHIVRWRVAE